MRSAVRNAGWLVVVVLAATGCTSSSDFFKQMVRGYGLEHGERHDLRQSAEFDTYVDRWESHEAVQMAQQAE